jgi:hypothetical protein
VATRRARRPPLRYYLFRTPDGAVLVRSGAGRQVPRCKCCVPLKAGPFTSYAEAEAARRRWEEPPRG